jgi:superfamily II DNA or RNA helicase
MVWAAAKGVLDMTNNPKLSLSLQFDSNNNPLSGVGPGVGLAFIKAYFPKAQYIIRIASAYFTLKGFKISRDFIAPKTQLQILVGREEGLNVQKTIKTIIHEIIGDFGNCEEDLYEAIADLKDRIKSGRFVIKDAREMQVKFHCKFYICDDRYIWHGSANYTGLGLTQSAEQVSVSNDLDEIRLFTSWYNNALKDARDLLSELIDELESLTTLVHPFDIYLKTLILLNNLPALKRRPNANIPTYFQKGVIANALIQTKQYGGGLIVAATGLGKTTIGAEIALHLQSEQDIKQVILIAPKGVMGNWKETFNSLNIYPEYFNIGILFRESTKGVSTAKQLEQTLKMCDSQTLIIIDEAHFYRNQLLSREIKGRESLVYKRLEPAVKAGAKVFLLTATVYGTNYQNLNSLLYILPHRKPNPPYSPKPWEANDAEEFTKLPVVTILGLPHVLKMARDRKDIDENGRTFIQISNERQYLPASIKLYSVGYELFLPLEISDAFESSCFDQANKIPNRWYDDDSRGVRESVTDSGRKAAIDGWLSSPSALADNIENNLSLGDETTPRQEKTLAPKQIITQTAARQKGDGNRTLMYLKLAERKKILRPIAGRLAGLDLDQDDKLLKLQKIILDHCVNRKSKVIVFVNRHRTAHYLWNALEQIITENIRIGCTVEFGEGNLRLKVDRSETLQQFSPRSHKRSNDYTSDEEYNVLICTDADGVGVNLQDADTVVNYDPPDSADVLFQRAGRVLRMTTDPNRTVHLYILTPTIIDSIDAQTGVYKSIKDIFNRLRDRHEKSRSILGSSVISKNEYTETKLDEEEIDVEELMREGNFLRSIGGLWAESMLNHTAILEEYRPRAESVPDYRLSAKIHSESIPYMFVLIESEKKYIPILYDIKHEYIERDEVLKILDLISCTETTTKADVEFPDVEHFANEAVQAWCKGKNIPVSSVRKICGLYLQPYDQAKDTRKAS